MQLLQDYGILDSTSTLNSSTSSVDSVGISGSMATSSPLLKRFKKPAPAVPPKPKTRSSPGQPAFATKFLLRWVQKTLAKRYGFRVKDFKSDWRDGRYFCALVHGIQPDLIDMQLVRRSSPRENLERAFSAAETHLGIARILDVEG